ncbi:MAG: hypothetical protein V3T05_05630 [Myxococcota bacterium]
MSRAAWTAAVVVVLEAAPAGAWGERGHDIVTQVAVRLAIERSGGNPALATPLLARSGMLGHLSNVPDIVWRAASPEVIEANGPTHYVALDQLAPAPLSMTLASLPIPYATAAAATRTRGHDLATQTGTAPWRVEQLALLLEQAWRRVAAIEKPTRDSLEEPVNEALLYAGLLSHFIADLANPDHTGSDFDGWHIKQGGLHDYFESKLVDALPLDLAQAVFDAARSRRPIAALRKKLTAAERQAVGDDALGIAFLVSLDSYRRRGDLFGLDLRYAILAPSRTAPARMPATRREPAIAAPKQRAFIVSRLALGADALATIWVDAWTQAGRPDMRNYQSYHYPVAPPFVPVSYVK